MRPVGALPAVLLGSVLACWSTSALAVKQKLTERPWTIVWLHGVDLVAGKAATLSFDADGRLSGSGGCNRLSGSYTLSGDGSTIAISNVSSTRMLCEGPVMSFERALIAALQSVGSASIDKDDRLVLGRAGTSVVILD